MDAIGAMRGEPGGDERSPLVVGVDGSDASWHALHYAFGLARRQRTAVVAIFAFMPITGWSGTCGAVWCTGEELAGELGAAVAALSEEHQVTAEFLQVQRDPVLCLVEVAAARHADAIIVGASKAPSRGLLGSKAARTIRRSRCPVIVVP